MKLVEHFAFLDRVAEELSRIPIEERHVLLCALLAWHVRAAPPDLTREALEMTVEDAFELLKKSRKMNIHAPSDLRH